MRLPPETVPWDNSLVTFGTDNAAVAFERNLLVVSDSLSVPVAVTEISRNCGGMSN